MLKPSGDKSLPPSSPIFSSLHSGAPLCLPPQPAGTLNLASSVFGEACHSFQVLSATLLPKTYLLSSESCSPLKGQFIYLLFFKKIFSLISERKEEGERDRYIIDERESLLGSLLHTSIGGLSLQPGLCPEGDPNLDFLVHWLIPNHWATPTELKGPI